MDWRRRCTSGLAGVLVGVLGCASAGEPAVPTDSGSAGGDSSSSVDSAPLIDALAMVTLSQTTDTNVVTGQTIACGNQTSGYTRENSWYRVFKLSDFQVTSALTITNVQIGVEQSSAGLAVQLKLGTYAGSIGGSTLDAGQITPLQSKTLNFPTAVVNALIDTPIDAVVPAGGTLIVEVFAPDAMAATKEFYAGSTAASETAPGYVRTPSCGGPLMPTSMKTVDPAAGSLVINVTGTHY